jgi:glycosyltransferase involved in cell wall biosynthesis
VRTSIVIRSRDEAARLRLVLVSLAGQDGLGEVVVVDDGSQDATPDVLAEAERYLPLTRVRHDSPRGRSAATNAGARAAGGDLLIFLDGDTLAGPGMVAAHAAAQSGAMDLVGRGQTWHLRCTRFFSDPEQGEFWPHEAHRAARMDAAERTAACVTAAQVRDDFEEVRRRAAPGVYPGAGPRRLHEVEMQALRDRPGSGRLWAAASGSNLSVRRDRFLEAGGLDPEIDLNEHRELAYRLCAAGARVAPVEDAVTYHLTHRSGWRDPLAEARWEGVFRRRHPGAPLEALKQFWRTVDEPNAAAAFFAA